MYIEQNKIIVYLSTPPTYERENFVQHSYLPTPRDMWWQWSVQVNLWKCLTITNLEHFS